MESTLVYDLLNKPLKIANRASCQKIIEFIVISFGGCS